MLHHPRRTAAAVLLCAALPSQKPPAATSFMPDEPHGEYFVDLARMRERGIWDELEHSLLAPAFRQMEKELGLPLDGLDRLRAWVRIVGDKREVRRLTTWEGKVGLPPSVNGESWSNETIGDYTAKVHAHFPELMVRVGDGLLVQGERELVEPVLLGKARIGRPGADQMSLLSGRHEDLVYVFVDLLAAHGSHGEFGFLSEIEYPEADPATHLLLRVRAQGGDDDLRLVLEGIVRHRRGDQGLKATEAAAKKWLEELQQHPRLAALKKLWAAVEFSTAGTDLVARLDLGRPRDAVGKLAQLMAPLFLDRAVQAQAAEQATRGAEEALKKAKEAEQKAKEEAEKAKGGGK